jgi:transcriptional regulator with GAF, ATPase, and Fis domain
MKPLDLGTLPDIQEKMKRFQDFIFNLSAEFIAMPATEVPDEIDRRLREIGEFWELSQIFLTRLNEDGSAMTTIHAYNAPDTWQAPKLVETRSVPWLMKTIRQGQPKVLTRVLDELPEDALLDRELIIRQGVKSALILPFIVGGALQGGLFFNNVRKFRDWPPDLVREMQHLGQILAGALERLQAFEHIQSAMHFDRLLSEISATYINLPAKDIVRHIKKDLGRVGSFLGGERCLFYLAGEKEGTFQIDRRFNWWHEGDNEQNRIQQQWINANPDFIDNFNFCFEKWNRGEIVKFSDPEDLPPEADKVKEIHQQFGTRSWLSVPIAAGGVIVGALVVGTIQKTIVWPEALIPRIRLFGEIFANAIKRKEDETSLRKAFREISRLKQQVEADYVYLRDELTLEHNFEEIIGQSDALKTVLFKVEQVAPTDSIVLVLGETGTGKELIARAIHHASRRSGRPLIKVNCATLTPNLVESELFGHEKGAFTGADKRRVGRFELADGATLFLDEIGELPLELQPKLLRVLQEGEFERLGGSRTLRVDVRIIAATNRNLEREVEKGRFRSDLWYRLNSFPIFIPPLRDRMEDLPLFVTHFVNQYCSKIGKRFDKIPKKLIQRLKRYSWPGNIRELENLISRAVIISEERNLQIHLPESTLTENAELKTYKDTAHMCILRTLEASGWKIEGPGGAAQTLNLKPSTLRNKMKKLGIHRQKEYR